MRKNTSLFYLVVLGFALAVSFFLQKAPRHTAKPQTKSSTQAPSSASVPTPAANVTPSGPEHTDLLQTRDYSATVSSLNAGLKSFTLKDPQFVVDGHPTQMVTTDRAVFYPFTFVVDGLDLGNFSGWQLQQPSPDVVRFTGTADGVAIARKLQTGKGPYQVWLTTTFENRSDHPRKLALQEQTYHYVPRAAESGRIPLLPSRSPAISSGLCLHADELERETRKALSSGDHQWHDKVHFVGIENVYFLSALLPEDKTAQECVLSSSDRGRDAEGKPLGTLFSATLRHKTITLAPGQKRTLRTLAYMGPKTPEELAQAGSSLRRAINTGFFSSLAYGLTALLGMIHRVVGNWGIAIILLTFFVKLTLYPLTHKQMESMAKMKELKPEMDRINAMYADDREKKGAAVMELYRKKGVNPMAGCFPVLLQLPIWFSLYSSLSSNIRLLHAPFALWWTDLSSPDPYFVLPLALGVLMFVQQKLAPPAGTDPLQAKMMLYMMPTMITSFMLFLPAGLCLYMFTNSALSIVQQRVIESRIKHTVSATASPSPKTPVVAEHNEPATVADSKDRTAQRRLRRGRK